MKNNMHIRFLTIICLIINTAHPSSHLIKLAQAISASPTKTKRTYARDSLMQEFKNIRYANARTLSTIVTTYHYKNETSLYSEHAGTLYEAIDNFSTSSGFARKIYELLHNSDNTSFIRGHMYELETAIALKDDGEIVTDFDYEFLCPHRSCTRSIDLVTERCLIECKNITWSAYSLNNRHRTTQLQDQLLSYKAFSNDEDENENIFSFLLYSKQPIPNEWKKWLDDNEIEYVETN